MKAKPSSALVLGCLLALALAAPVGGQVRSVASPSPEPGAQVALYDVGEATIEQPPLQGTGFFAMPIPLRGVLAVPAGDGSFPVVVLVHGNYPFCDAPLLGDEPDPYPCPAEHDLRQFEGFEDLAARLATHGYLTLVPDMSPEYTNGYGSLGFGDRAIQIIDAHLAALTGGSGMPMDITGKADLERLVFAGHSRGGPLAVRYLTDEGAEHAPIALALVMPAAIESGPEAVVPRAMPTALMIADCDGDVGTEQPRQYLRQQLAPDRPGLTLVYAIAGGTHNAVSTRLGRDMATDCTIGQLMAPASQRARTAAFLAGFFDMALELR